MAQNESSVKTARQKPAPRAGFDDKGEAYPGVDPETGERKSVTLEGLKKEFGAKEGERIYFEIAEIGGYGINAQSPNNNAGALSLTGLDKEKRAQVDALLGGQ